MSSDPVVTVLLPLYNGAHYVREAVESILRQTWKDFELLIIDDGSTDTGPEIVTAMRDERIILLRNPSNMGVAATLNRGLDVARGHYIARMDADDISLPDRLERQIRFMDEHPDVGISGGWVRLFGGGELPYTCRVPSCNHEVAAYCLFENPLWHMAVIMRKDALNTHGLRYNPDFSRSEDYDLWIRAGHNFLLANLARVLVRVRRTQGSATRANWNEVTRQTEVLLGRQLSDFGMSVTEEEVAFHHRIGRGYRLTDQNKMKLAESWLSRLLLENSQRLVFDEVALRKVIGMVWFRVCANSGTLGPWMWQEWRRSPLAASVKISVSDQLRFLSSIIWHMARRKSKAIT
jgi:glycosyltransferase involved in cell wall biosynthesis